MTPSGKPIEEPEFDFGIAAEDPVKFLQTVALLEATSSANSKLPVLSAS